MTLRHQLQHTRRELTRVLRDSTAWYESTIFFVMYVRDGSCYEYVVSGSPAVYLPVRNGSTGWFDITTTAALLLPV